MNLTLNAREKETRMTAKWMRNTMIWGIVVVVGVTAQAASPTFQITALFSNLDGRVQFIRLTETAGLDGQHGFAGLKLRSTHGGVVKEFTFPHDLPEPTAHRSVLVATQNGIRARSGGGSFPSTPTSTACPSAFFRSTQV